MWVRSQRKNRSNNKLTPEQIQKLDKLNFIWTVSEYKWSKGYNYYKEFIEKTTGSVLAKNQKIDGFNISLWAKKQRRDKRDNVLKVEQINKLDALGFDWNPSNEPSNEPSKKL